MNHSWLTKNVEQINKSQPKSPEQPLSIDEDKVDYKNIFVEMLQCLRMLVNNVKEDRAFRLKTRFNAVDPLIGTTTSTGDTKLTYTEPVSEFTVSCPAFGSATKVFIAIETSSFNQTNVITLTPSLPSRVFSGLQCKNINISSDVSGATVEVIGLRGL